MALIPSFTAAGGHLARAWQHPWLRRGAIALLGAASIGFLLLAIRDASSAEIMARIDATNLAVIVLSGGVYGLLLALLAKGWAQLPAPAGMRVGWVETIAVYGTSILPKYLPGSILQYGSRQHFGARLGWPAGRMAQASLLEVALHVLCPLILTLALLIPGTTWETGSVEALWLAVLGGASVVAAGVLVVIGGRGGWFATLRAAGLQLLFFAGMALLAMVCGLLFGVAPDRLAAVGGLFLVSWLIGFAVPLAPGGVGVREASGVALLSGQIGLETALLILAAMRIVPLIGDTIMFIAGIACQRRLRLG